MSENPPEPRVKFELGQFGGIIEFSTPGELRKLAEDEWNAWAWIEATGNPQLQNTITHHKNLRIALINQSAEWTNRRANPNMVGPILDSINQALKAHYLVPLILHSSSVEAHFLSDLRHKRGSVVAAGAYAGFLKNVLMGAPNSPEFYDGMFEAFLFKRGALSSAEAHLEVFKQLRTQYEANITNQETRVKEIELKNNTLNTEFKEALDAKTVTLSELAINKEKSLNELHKTQSDAFSDITTTHVENLKAIETTYNQKLALERPVTYWQDKENHHKTLSFRFGVVALLTMIVLASAIGTLIYEVLSHLDKNENPKSWQVGVCLTALFFSIWIVRILVRLFLSHSHLAGDAAERRTMILTYLSMAREGSAFAADDKKLILQHIFRSTSDGLVKDDGAPPTPLEILSRGR